LGPFEFRRTGDGSIQYEISCDFLAAAVAYADDNPNRRVFIRTD
jgi:hypothetical protein